MTGRLLSRDGRDRIQQKWYNNAKKIIQKSWNSYTSVVQTENIIKKVVQQGSIFGPITCCVITPKVNDIKTSLQCNYGKDNIGISVYMDHIAAAWAIAEDKKEINNRAKVEKGKEMRFGVKKTKWMMIKTGKEREKTHIRKSKIRNSY